jgi:hypothetical protein
VFTTPSDTTMAIAFSVLMLVMCALGALGYWGLKGGRGTMAKIALGEYSVQATCRPSGFETTKQPEFRFRALVTEGAPEVKLALV